MQLNLEASGMMEFFELLPQVCSGGVYLFDAKTHKFLYTNPYIANEFFRGNINSQTCLEDLIPFVHPLDRKYFEDEIRLVSNLHLNQQRELNLRFQFPNRSHLQWFHFNERIVSIPNISPSPLVIGFVGDVTNEKVTEENVQEQMRLFLGLFENASIGMALQDWEGGYFRINDRFTEITGYTIAELTNMNLMRVKGEHLSSDQLAYFKIVDDGLEIGEATLTRKDGRKINIYKRTNIFKNSKGKPDFYYVILDDLTEKKQIESYLLHSQKMETIGNLAANLAHDLNNYLQPIHVFSQLGQENLLLEETKEFQKDKLKDYFYKIAQAASSARSMIHKILRFSKINESEVISIVDISAIIQSSIPILVAEAPKFVDLQFSLSEENLLWAKVDPVRISKIIGEIISGTIFSWDKAKDCLVKVSTSLESKEDEHSSRIITSIELNGIDADSFTSFLELQSSIFEEDESRWAGLQLIHRYIRNWQGECQIEKINDHIVVIRILLPLTKHVNDKEINYVSDLNLKREDVWKKLEGKIFWIVEDDEPSRDSLALVLSMKNIKPILFESSPDALEAVNTKAPDFVLSDYRMKDINGLTLLRKLKAKNPLLVSVLYTGNADGLDAEALEGERILVRSKPISIDELYESILLSFDFL
ncbi:MAG: PAS domain S-box protein [Leptospira sp.]|nr:PAS domain S-box protein [Leptospira sp.]